MKSTDWLAVLLILLGGALFSVYCMEYRTISVNCPAAQPVE